MRLLIQSDLSPLVHTLSEAITQAGMPNPSLRFERTWAYELRYGVEVTQEELDKVLSAISPFTPKLIRIKAPRSKIGSSRIEKESPKKDLNAQANLPLITDDEDHSSQTDSPIEEDPRAIHILLGDPKPLNCWSLIFNAESSDLTTPVVDLLEPLGFNEIRQEESKPRRATLKYGGAPLLAETVEHRRIRRP